MQANIVSQSIALGLGVLGASLVAAQSLDSHEHGASDLNIARLGNTLQVEFLSPAINLLTFERAPVSDEEQARFGEVSAQLESGVWLFGNALADCRMQLTSLEVPEFSDHESHDDDHEYEAEHHDEHAGEHAGEHGGHSDFRVEYQFECPDEIPATLTVQAFTQFPGISEINVQWISDQGQGMAKLTARNTTLRLR